MSAKNYWLAFGIGVTGQEHNSSLYAPQTGVKTRKQLRKRAEDASDYLEDAGNYLKARLTFSEETQKAIKRTKGQVSTPLTRQATPSNSAV